MTDEEIASRLSQCTLGAERSTFATGALFGDWRLTAFISRGGTSAVYAAEHIALGTPAAVKFFWGQTPGKWGQTPTRMLKKSGLNAKSCVLNKRRGFWLG